MTSRPLRLHSEVNGPNQEEPSESSLGALAIVIRNVIHQKMFHLFPEFSVSG